MANKTVRRSITITQEMHDRLALLVSKQPRDTTEADVIREAVRLYLDNREDIIGSRKHFQKSLQERLDKLEAVMSFHLNILIYLLAASVLMAKIASETQKQSGGNIKVASTSEMRKRRQMRLRVEKEVTS